MSGPLRRVVTIANPQGLHMRPAAAFAELASRFESTVTIHKGDQAVDGKNMVELLLLAAEPGTQLEVLVNGKDAADALEVLAELLESVPVEPNEDTVAPEGEPL
jgi:phosphotransferase system HPr (HPr) family protein